MGAWADLGEFGPPYDVSPQALTRAFLASRNADGGLDDMNTLGKRITSGDFPLLPAAVPWNLRLMVYACLDVRPESRPKVAILGRAALAASKGIDLLNWSEANQLFLTRPLSKPIAGLLQERQAEAEHLAQG